MSAAVRQPIPTLPEVATPARVVALELFRLFDKLTSFGYSAVDLFEHSAPGATEALRAWAEASGLTLLEKSVAPPGVPAMTMLVCQLKRPDGGDGVRITVTRHAEQARPSAGRPCDDR